MMYMRGVAYITCFVLLALAPANLPAADCFDPSPTKLKGQDIFNPVVPRDLNPIEHGYVRKMLRALDGGWVGEGTETRCKRSSDPADQEEYRFRLRGDVDTDSYGNLLLDIDLYDENNRTSHAQVFRLYLDASRLRYEYDDGAGDVELLSLTPSEIKFIFRVTMRGRRLSGTPTRKEFFISLRTGADAFDIDRDIYTRGKLTAKWRWRFKRK